jgi:uncharacterized protein (TIGR02266 family)
MADDSNRRSSPRLPALLRVDYPHLTTFLADYSENISRNGLFIVTDQEHALGTEVEFKISFAGLLAPLTLRGIVRWRRAEANEEGQKGIGIELVFDDEEKADAMARLVASAEAARATGPATPRSDEPRRFGVLLAEDNPHVSELFAYGMKKLAQNDLADVKIEVHCTANGNDAWTTLMSNAIDLIITDMYMPVLDGGELIRRVRASPQLRTIPIVAVSSGGAEARKEALEAGADIFLPKPVKLSDIVATVGALLRLSTR